MNFATNVVILDVIAKIRNRWMSWIVGTKDFDGLLDTIWLVDIIDCKGCQL